MERPQSSGRYAPVEVRALRPAADVTPNGNPDVAPSSVGPEVYAPGDPSGVEVMAAAAPSSGWPPSIITPSPWSGWPAEWDTPAWSTPRLEDLTDTAWTCIDLNASVLASMPAYLVGASPGLPHGWLDNPDPDRYTSWVEFLKQLLWDYQAAGEAFVLTTARYDNLYPARFHVVRPWLVNVEIEAGLRRYFIGRLDVTDDVLHIRYSGPVDDARGRGPLEAGRTRLLAARVLARYVGNLIAGGAVPPGILKHPDELSGAQITDLQNQWLAARMSRLGLPAILHGGMEWEATAHDPAKLGLQDLATFNEGRVAVLLGVPPFLVGLPSGGDSMTYSNVSSIFDYHWRAGLRTKARMVMPALSAWLTPRGTRLEVNADAYVQPGPLERAQTWDILIRNNVVTPEQVAAIERFVVAGDPSSAQSMNGMMTL